ncbi:MAG: aminopeptidase [Candidatus Aenigmarchaeota archaeon]|nr:aminopeptidase [Candidatus Aenigmarchaeota archaeon]
MENSVKKNMQISARVCVRTCMKVKPDENVLIVNENNNNIVDAFKEACEGAGATARIKNVKLERDREEPPEEITIELMNSNVVLLATQHSLTHTTAVINAQKSGVRIASLPGITEEMFCRAVPVDYVKMHELGEKVKRILEKNEFLRVKTDKGTNVELEIKGRTIIIDSGIIDKHNLVNLPDGEVEVAPLETKTNGKIVVDGCGSPVCETKFGRVGKIKQDIILSVENGRVVNIEGGEQAEILKNILEDMNDPGAYVIAEFAVGINPKAKITDKILESEKVLGTVHFALGENRSMGGINESKVHWDFVLKDPKIYSKDGELIIDCSRL